MKQKSDARIIVSGRGVLNADVVAVGYKARAQKTVSDADVALSEKGLSEVQTKLNTLFQELNVHGQKLKDPKPVYDLTERIANELKSEKPDKLTVKSFLSRIIEEASSVAEIVSAAISLKDIMDKFFG